MNTLKQIGIQQWRRRSAPGLAQPLADSGLTTDAAENAVQPNQEMSRERVDVIRSEPALDPTPVALAPAPSPISTPANDPLADLDWQSMQSMIETDQYCPSCRRGNSILGSGDTQADWMFVTDAPGSNDVQEDQLLTGRAGKLFEAMLQALGLERSVVYASSVFKCAPLDDLTLSPACNKLLHRQIELVQPKVVVTFGEFAAQAVIKANESLAVLRAKDQQCFSTKVAIVPTYSPAQMLDDNGLKAMVWSDLKKCLRFL